MGRFYFKKGIQRAWRSINEFAIIQNPTLFRCLILVLVVLLAVSFIWKEWREKKQYIKTHWDVQQLWRTTSEQQKNAATTTTNSKLIARNENNCSNILRNVSICFTLIKRLFLLFVYNCAHGNAILPCPFIFFNILRSVKHLTIA